MEAPLHAIAEGPPGGRAWWARAEDGPRLRIAHWPAEAQRGTAQAATPGAPRGTAIIFTGRTEYVEKYGRTAAELAARGWDTLSLDWRGQGLSDRSPGVAFGHVARFGDYQADVAVLMAAAAAMALPRPWLMIAHSMGGAIGFRALRQGLGVDAAAFSAPMWGLGANGLRRAMAWGVSTLARRLAQGHRLTPGTSALSYVMNTDFAGNELTSDLDGYAHLRRQLTRHPELALGGPSLGWLAEALREIAWIRRQPCPALPTAIALGSAETIIDPGAVRATAARWPGARIDLYEGARHEILIETPAHRRRFLDAALALAG